MKTFQSLLPAFGLVAAAQAWAGDWNSTYTTVTITTDVYTTYCPLATTFTQGTKTYTATASETITVTDCPCELTTSYPAWGTGTGTGSPKPTTTPPVVWTTTTLTTDVLTTYCPSPTTFVQGSSTYVVTEATTLTITACPCTEVISSTVPPTSAPSVIPPPASVNGTIITPPKTIWETVSTLTTYCPSSTVVTIGSQTLTLSSGTQTVPIVSPTVITPIATLSATKTPVGPTSATTTGPLQVTGAAMRFEVPGALAAAGLAVLLL